MEKGTEEWNLYKKELIESILGEINYMYIIEEFFENYFLDFKSDINEKMSNIFNNDFKAKFALVIQEKHHSIFLSIKNTIPQIETLNLIITKLRPIELRKLAILVRTAPGGSGLLVRATLLVSVVLTPMALPATVVPATHMALHPLAVYNNRVKEPFYAILFTPMRLFLACIFKTFMLN